jgi:hypothetical protein
MNHLMRLSFFFLSCLFLSCTQKEQEEKMTPEEDVVQVEEDDENWNPQCNFEGDLLLDPQEIVPSEMLSVPTIP